MYLSAADGVIATTQAAITQAEATKSSLAACDEATSNAEDAFYTSGGADKLAIITAIQKQLRQAAGMQSEVDAALAEALRLAGVLSAGNI